MFVFVIVVVVWCLICGRETVGLQKKAISSIIIIVIIITPTATIINIIIITSKTHVIPRMFNGFWKVYKWCSFVEG